KSYHLYRVRRRQCGELSRVRGRDGAMRAQLSGRATTFGAIQPRLCCATALREQRDIGLRNPGRGRGIPSRARRIVEPEHSRAHRPGVPWLEAGAGPGSVAAAPPGDWPLLALPEAMFQPAVDPAHIQADGADPRAAGMLLLVEERWLLAVSDEGGTALVDIKSG